jgi:hypothetical protein
MLTHLFRAQGPLHLYNETWRRAGTDKNAPFRDGSLVAQLAARQPAP